MLKIYTLSSTRNPDNIRYIGKTIRNLNARLSQHLSDSRRCKNKGIFTVHNYNWINKEISEGYSIIIEELDCLDLNLNSNWKWLEQYWISQFKAWGFKLNNLTSGGDGNQDQTFSQEAIEKRRQKLLGTHRPKEVRDKISKSKSGKKLSQKHKSNVRKTMIKLHGKSINQYDLNGNLINTWDCIKDAANYYNVDSGNIIKCCKNHPAHSTCAGFIWRYTDNKVNSIIQKKFVNQYDTTGHLINTWNSAMQAAKELNYSYSKIYRCIKNKKESYNGYIWKYELMNI